MKTEAARITPEDRAALCSRVDFLAVLSADGIQSTKAGDHYLARLRHQDKTPSCHVWPPGAGRKGSAGWTWKDYGDGKGGDALGYLVDVRGLSYVDAVRLLAGLTGFWPAGMKPLEKEAPGCPRNASKAPAHTVTPHEPAASPAPPTLPPDEQFRAAAAFIHGLATLHPQAAAEGDAYLRRRGVLPEPWPNGTAYHLPADLCRPLATALAEGPDADLLRSAGLLLPAEDAKPLRLPWWGDCCLLVCRDAEAYPVYLLARRLDWKQGDRAGKYLNQPTRGGAVRWPFNLPAMYAAAGRLDAYPWQPAKDKAAEVLLVEGPLDAMGAAVLGWAAVALLSRPQAHGPEDRSGAAVKMLEDHLPVLRSLRRVRVVPDADAGDKGAEGEALAARLVGWLRSAGCRAEVSTLSDLQAEPLPENVKDLADLAAAVKGCPP